MLIRMFHVLILSVLVGEQTELHASVVPRCDTHNHLTATDRPAAMRARPGFDYSLSSSKHPIVVHATTATGEAYAQRILGYADQSWDVIIDRMGFREPRPDHAEDVDSRIDIYIRGDLTPGVGGYAGFGGYYEETPEADAYGYLVIADQLKDTYIRGVVAHEFFHLSQMSYDWFEHPGFMEATSVWVTDQVFDDENFYQNYYAYFNKSPYQSLDKISLADPYQYGAGLWFQYLDERFGEGDGSFTRRIWELSIQDGMDTEPDYFDAMTKLLGDDDTLKAAFRDFGRWRFHVGSRAGVDHLREAEIWPDRVIPMLVESGSLDENKLIEWTVPTGMEPYSHSYLRFTIPPQVQNTHFELNFELDPERVGQIQYDILHSSPSEVIVILTRAFESSYDPETSPEDPVSVSGTVRLGVTR